MARVSIAVLERELEYARKREAYLRSTTARPVKATVDARPKQLVAYRSSSLLTGAISNLYKVQATSASLVFFNGIAALGLSATLTDASPAPRGFQPAKISAVIGDATPSVKIAAGSTRRYIKYSANSAGDAQAHYSAPVSKVEPNVTADEQKDFATLLAAAIDGKLGGQYGRVSFTPEKYTSSLK
jgi:hypothetical protein